MYKTMYRPLLMTVPIFCKKTVIYRQKIDGKTSQVKNAIPPPGSTVVEPSEKKKVKDLDISCNGFNQYFQD
jgi:hypothetical protein